MEQMIFIGLFFKNRYILDNNNNNLQSWNDYFDSNLDSPSEFGKFYISDATYINYTGFMGGAISILSDSDSSQVLIESCTFIRCKTDYYLSTTRPGPETGGAINIRYCGLIMAKIYGYQCHCRAGSEGNFLYNRATENCTTKLLLSQITLCAEERTYATLSLYYGMHILKSLNLSNNYCNYYSPIYSELTNADKYNT